MPLTICVTAAQANTIAALLGPIGCRPLSDSADVMVDLTDAQTELLAWRVGCDRASPDWPDSLGERIAGIAA